MVKILNSVSENPLYKTWRGMKNRCFNKNDIGFNLYGGRGIKVCDRWVESFENFFEDMGERPNGMTLERINNDGNYEPLNCKWATPKEQARNRRTNRYIDTIQGKMLIVEAAEIAGISGSSISYRENTKTDLNDILKNKIPKKERVKRNVDGIKKTTDLVKTIILDLQNKGMTQWQIADSIGTNQAPISRWLSGKNIPSGDLLMKLMMLNNKK